MGPSDREGLTKDGLIKQEMQDPPGCCIFFVFSGTGRDQSCYFL